MTEQWKFVSGVVIRGYQVASGIAKDNPFGRGTIELQSPIFKELGLDISWCLSATLNVSISPCVFSMERPQYTFKTVKWHETYQAENFSFSCCRVDFKNRTYKGLVYYPDPATKEAHFHNSSIIEILAEKIPEIKYGDAVILWINPKEIMLRKSDK